MTAASPPTTNPAKPPTAFTVPAPPVCDAPVVATLCVPLALADTDSGVVVEAVETLLADWLPDMAVAAEDTVLDPDSTIVDASLSVLVAEPTALAILTVPDAETDAALLPETGPAP